MLMLKEHLETMILVVNFSVLLSSMSMFFILALSTVINISLELLSQLMLSRLVKDGPILGMFLG